MVPDLQPTPLTKVQFCLRRSSLARVALMRRVGDLDLLTTCKPSGSEQLVEAVQRRLVGARHAHHQVTIGGDADLGLLRGMYPQNSASVRMPVRARGAGWSGRGCMKCC